MTTAPVRSSEPLFTAPFIRLWCFTFITFFSAFQLFPVIPFRIIELGGNRSEAGAFLAIYTLSCAFAAPVTGLVADRYGRRRLLIISAVAFIFFSLLEAVVTTIPLLLVVGCFHGMFWSAILSSSAAILSEIIPGSRRTEGLAYWGMASTAAIAIAPLVGLQIFSHFGWGALCLEMALISAVMIIMAVRVETGEGPRMLSFPPIHQLVDWRVMLTAMSLAVVTFGYGGITSYVALLSEERGIAPRSLFFSVFAASILITRVLTASWGDRFGPLWLLFPSLIVIPVALAILATAQGRPAVVIAAFLYGAGFGGSYPAFVTFVLARSDPERRAATFGSILWAFDTGIAAGSLVIGILVGHYGFRFAYQAAAVLSVLAIPVFMATSRLLPAPGREVDREATIS